MPVPRFAEDAPGGWSAPGISISDKADLRFRQGPEDEEQVMVFPIPRRIVAKLE